MKKTEKDLTSEEHIVNPKFLYDFYDNFIVTENVIIGKCENCNKENVKVIKFSMPYRTFKFESTFCADCFLDSLKNDGYFTLK